MFDPKKLVSPIGELVNQLIPTVNELSLSEDKTIVKEVTNVNGHYNTLATVDVLDEELTISRIDRELLYNRVDIGEYTVRNSNLIKDNNNVERYAIVTDSVKLTNRNPNLTDIASVFNSRYNLPILETDLEMRDNIITLPRESSFGILFKQVNCTIANNTVMYTGGTISVYHKSDTYIDKYNRVTTTQCGAMIHREWLANEVTEITLPDSSIANGWTMLLESIDEVDEVGNGELWFKVKFDNLINKWIYSSPECEEYIFETDTLSKIRMTLNENGMSYECLSLVNNNAYEVQYSELQPVLLTSRGLQRLSIYSNNPSAPAVSFKIKTTSVDITFASKLKDNIKTYDSTSNLLAAHPNSNALFGNVIKPIILTNYETDGFVETQVLNKFASQNNKNFGVISTIDSFDSTYGQDISIVNPKLGQLFKTGVIKSITLELVNRLNTNVRYKAIFTVIDIVDDLINGDLKTYVNGTANIDINKNISADITHFNIGVLPNQMTISTSKTILSNTNVNQYHDSGETIQKKYKTIFTIELNDGQNMPSFTILKKYPLANPL